MVEPKLTNLYPNNLKSKIINFFRLQRYIILLIHQCIKGGINLKITYYSIKPS